MITFSSTSGDSPVRTNNVRRHALTDIKHGTARGYSRCRKGDNGACEACRKAIKEAWDRQLAARRAKPIPLHLEHGAYVHRNYNCDCDTCVTDAKSKSAERQRRFRARKRREARS
jgi:hypothetical protein